MCKTGIKVLVGFGLIRYPMSLFCFIKHIGAPVYRNGISKLRRKVFLRVVSGCSLKKAVKLYSVGSTYSLALDCYRLLSSPNKQSGKYNEMDPILIGTAVSEHVIREMIKPAVPLVKAL